MNGYKKDFVLEELFDYEKIGISEKSAEMQKNSDFIEVAEPIKNFMNFAIKTHFELTVLFPEDDYLKFLSSDEGVRQLLSYNWYEKYNVEYKI